MWIFKQTYENMQAYQVHSLAAEAPQHSCTWQPVCMPQGPSHSLLRASAAAPATAHTKTAGVAAVMTGGRHLWSWPTYGQHTTAACTAF